MASSTPEKQMIIPCCRKRCFHCDDGAGRLNKRIKKVPRAAQSDSYGSNSYPLLLYRANLVARKFPQDEELSSDVNKQFREEDPSGKIEGDDFIKKRKTETKAPRQYKYYWSKIDDKSKPQEAPRNASTSASSKPKAKRGRKPKVSTTTNSDSSSSPPPCPETPTKIHEPLLRILDKTPDKENGERCRRALNFDSENVTGNKVDPMAKDGKWLALMHPSNQNGLCITTSEGSQIFSEEEKEVMERALVISQEKGQSLKQGKKAAERALVKYRKKDRADKIKNCPSEVDSDVYDVWKLLMNGEDVPDPKDEKTKDWWDGEIKRFLHEVGIFMDHMRHIQGDRRYSRWKGSVLDSVVGVYLTQNVSDVLSSSAFMSLISKYPAPHMKYNEHRDDDADDKDEIPNTEDQNQNRHQNNDGGCIVDDMSINTPSQNGDLLQTNEVRDDVKDGSTNTLGQNKDRPQNNESTKDEVTNESTNIPGQNDNEPESPNTQKRQEKSSTKNQDEMKEKYTNWDELRTKYSTNRPRHPDTYDAVDYEAIRQATVEELAKVIRDRGQHNKLAKRIKDLLDRLVQQHGSIDLEWLRDVPPHDAKQFLLSIHGIGLKSAECVRLLCLLHHAFPVDTNVARVAVRLGWVPLKELPEYIHFHELRKFPLFDDIQKYLWARLHVLPQDLLYELHYHMITAGKVFCTKVQPNCNVCPMKDRCKYFASKYSSVNLQLPRLPGEGQTKADAQETFTFGRNSKPTNETSNSEPLIEFPASPGPHPFLERDIEDLCRDKGPIIEMPASPTLVSYPNQDRDIDDLLFNDDYDEGDVGDYGEEDDDEMPTIVLNPERFTETLLEALERNRMARQNSESGTKAIVAISPEHASLPHRKFKILGRLSTVLTVYELDDRSPILEKFEKRVPEDPYPYLFRMWTKDESEKIIIKKSEEQKSDEQIVYGTILIPCRTATRGYFPLGATYFQPNEVFADHESSRIPFSVHRDWLWNRPMRYLYCGTMVASIHKDFFSTKAVAECCLNGYYCSRGFERKTRGVRTLSRMFHTPNKETPVKKGNLEDNVAIAK